MRTAIAATAFAVITAAAATRAAALASGVDVIRLPDGFVPEGIASLGGPYFLVGSLLDGRLWAGNYASGTGVEVFNAPGQTIVGVVADPAGGGVAWAAGGGNGNILAFGDGGGTLLANLSVPAGPPGSPAPFVNDGDVVRDGAAQFAAFTDSFNPAIYTVPLSAVCGGGGVAVQRVPLTGDFMQGESYNANGMRYSYTAHTLVMVQSNTGKLFTVATDGVTKEIDVGGSLGNGDGILFDAVDPAVLYVVQNREGAVVVVRFTDPATLRGGRVVATLTRDEWSSPTTVAQFSGALFVVDSRFDVAPPGAARARR
eukprot:TRINITY_DN4280_c0_g1_i2.p2 TRINITY_DN4280_c0_g1~~TRINITY_DN4280_c0_g1_i2.p2  ORF type:complete len:327 (-),score=119.15 TRINITY_DN4280_c0_g1_i2:241-1179(-)